ncbi:MAG: hypothetical protein U5N86_06820 [Planctomycetota bacterium]|nr:hypothetical protein [Planctomycetota bacterium]
MRRVGLFLLLSVFVGIAIACGGGGGGSDGPPEDLLADFGDMSDGTFPTKYSTGNAWSGRTAPYHLDTSHEWIGQLPVSSTSTENDAKLTDIDEDDGYINIRTLYNGGTQFLQALVSVSVGTDSNTATRYLNVACDLNRSGNFAGYMTGGFYQHEWVIINMPIRFTSKNMVVSGTFRLFDRNALDAFPCTRATISTAPIDPSIFGTAGWDGSGPVGGFTRGETEDWCPSSVNVVDPVPQFWHNGLSWKFPEFPPAPDPNPNPGPPVTSNPSDPPVNGEPANPVPVKDTDEIFPYEDAPVTPTPMSEPDDTAPPPEDEPEELVDNAYLPGDMVDKKQPQGSDECGPYAAANSVQYMMKRAGLLDYLKENGASGEHLFAPLEPLSPSASPAEHQAWEDAFHERLREIMSRPAVPGDDPGGMMNSGEGEGTTIGGFVRGKQYASDAIEQTGQGSGIETTRQNNPNFQAIHDAIQNGDDVELLLGYYDPDTDERVGGHYVVVTGATRDSKGNMTFTFVDPACPEKGEQTYTVANKDRDDQKGGAVVKDYPALPEGSRVAVDAVVNERIVSTR